MKKASNGIMGGAGGRVLPAALLYNCIKKASNGTMGGAGGGVLPAALL
jgi:hypothetical protein